MSVDLNSFVIVINEHKLDLLFVHVKARQEMCGQNAPTS